MLRKVMIRAHQIAKNLEGDYQARLSLALRQAWKEERGNEKMGKQLVIADWWLRKNPAQEVIINEFEEVEVTKETEKAYLLNDKVWVPKSVVEWGKAKEIETAEKDERISLELLAKVTGRDPERLKINTTIKSNFPAVFKKETTIEETQKTIDNMLSEAGLRSDVRNEFKKTLKEKGYKFRECMEIMNEGKEGFNEFALGKLEELA